MADFHRNYSREDPRLSRRNSSQSPIRRKSPPPPMKMNLPGKEDWNTQTRSYNHQQALQDAYQSLNYQNPSAQQYPQQTYYTGYQSYTYNPYENYQAMQQSQYLNPPTEPRPPGEEYPHAAWASTNPNSYGNGNSESAPPPQPEYTSTSLPPPPAGYKKKDDGIAEEKNKHLASLMKERETYEERVYSLKKKLQLLVDQKDTLTAKGTPDKETMRILKENSKLQLEIQNKIKDSTNVIEILSDLIGDKKKPSKAEEKPKEVVREESYSKDEKINFKHYDPEIHWCRMCDVFPQTAKELLLHLHSKSHQETVQEENPWHKLPPEPKFPTHEGAAVRRLPIKGLQFFVASTAWYCRLCDTWIGDLHCASQHLMSVTHSQNYTNFVEQNPHWETEWLKDREKALERVRRKTGSSDSEDRKKRKHKDSKYSPSAILAKEKKKKKRSKKRKKHSSDESSSSSSSSSSSDDEKEDRSKSIRVAMRNKMKLLAEGGEAKWDILGKLVEEERRRHGPNRIEPKQNTPPPPPPTIKDDSMMSQWASVSEPQEKDKYLLDSLKEKLKLKHEAEKAKQLAELEAVRRMKEKEEAERKQQEMEQLRAKQMRQQEEEEKHREKINMKLRENKSHKRETYRDKSLSKSPDRRRRKSRSTSREKRRNGRVSSYDDRSPARRMPERSRERSNRDRTRSRSRERDHHHHHQRERSHDADRSRDGKSREFHEKDREREAREERKAQLNKKLPFIGRMPLFKGTKTKKVEEEPPKREIQKEEYDAPRKTRFQPGNLAKAFIPQPEVVCFPQLSSYPPIPPPPPPIIAEPPAPKISVPKAPPAPKLAEAKKAIIEEEEEEEETKSNDMEEEEDEATIAPAPETNYSTAEQPSTNPEEYMLYEDTSNNMYPYGNMDYNVMYQTHPSYNFMQMSEEVPAESDIPKAHTMPLEPPPLPPDDPNEDLAMLGLSSDDLAVQQMIQ